MKIENLKEKFVARYGEANEEILSFFSPGRVNLIGEHTDYNGGYVFPCALSFGIYFLVRKSKEKKIKFISLNYDYTSEIDLDNISNKHGDKWINYPLGIINEFISKGINIPGMEFLFWGNIPKAAGLSSSASIEIVTAVGLNETLKAGIDRIELVKMSKHSENEFIGVSCGIMDMFAVCMGKKDHAIFLQCDSLEYQLVPINTAGCKLVISNTNKSRGLADSKFNERVAECNKAVEYINKEISINLLAEINPVTFNKIQNLIPDNVIKRRAKHVIFENYRVLDAVEYLKKGNLLEFGRLMNESHDSLRDDYEVTGIELDTLVEEARKIKGVIGSRMTGAGFGGCTVSLVKEESIPEFKDKVGNAYQKRTGLLADFYIADIGDGAQRILFS